MCIINIIKAGFMLFLISGAAFTSGCTDNAQTSLDGNALSIQMPEKSSLNTEYELEFMKDILNEMKNQGKNITLPLETYRLAKAQVKDKNLEGFKESLSLFYEQCNIAMVNVYNISVT